MSVEAKLLSANIENRDLIANDEGIVSILFVEIVNFDVLLGADSPPMLIVGILN